MYHVRIPVGSYGLGLCEELDPLLAVKVQVPKHAVLGTGEGEEGQRHGDGDIDANVACVYSASRKQNKTESVTGQHAFQRERSPRIGLCTPALLLLPSMGEHCQEFICSERRRLDRSRAWAAILCSCITCSGTSVRWSPTW